MWDDLIIASADDTLGADYGGVPSSKPVHYPMLNLPCDGVEYRVIGRAHDAQRRSREPVLKYTIMVASEMHDLP